MDKTFFTIVLEHVALLSLVEMSTAQIKRFHADKHGLLQPKALFMLTIKKLIKIKMCTYG